MGLGLIEIVTLTFAGSTFSGGAMAKTAGTASSAPPAPSAVANDDVLTRLAKRGRTKQAGLVDDAGFTAAKARLLGI
jgi:hypothetical protein